MNTRAFLPLPLLALVVALGAGRLAGAEAPAAQSPPPAPGPAPAAPAAKDAPPAPRTSVALPMTTRFNQTRARIDALYAQRNAPPPPVSSRSNPFRAAGALPAAAGPVAAPVEGAVPESPVRDAAPSGLLQPAIATLKLSGMFERADVVHVVINKRSYKEGDVVPTTVNGEAVYLRVKSIVGRSVVLALDGAEMTLNF